MNPKTCFEELCTCRCSELSPDFDEIVQTETKFLITLESLCHSNIGWFSDKTLCDHHLEEWELSATEGVYLLWHKDGYCDAHELFHMKCLYVGKGKIPIRLSDHWKSKDFSEEMLVYWTFLEMPNRQAKYVEQLLLDLYSVPRNKYEPEGTRRLCAHLTQCEVD